MIEKKEFPTLQALSMSVVAKNYHLYPQLQGIPERIKQTIIDKSISQCQSEGNSLSITAPNIQQQKYWKAKCQRQKNKYFPIKLQDHGLSWKIAYIEKSLQKLIQSINEYGEKQRENLIKTLKVINPWVFSLDIRINASELKINEICKFLTNIVNLKIKCSEGKNTDFKKKIVGMKFSQARDICDILYWLPNLISLNLSGNLVDDDLFKVICPGLTLNTTLIELNLSHNKIGDQGARKLAKILIKNNILTHLNLASNSIGYDGSRYLSQALKLNTTLQYLSLKLNSIDDKAGAKFFKDLTFNTNLQVLDLEANLLSSMSVRKISLYLQVPNSIKQIYIGSNNFTQEELGIISDALALEVSRQYFKKNCRMISSDKNSISTPMRLNIIKTYKISHEQIFYIYTALAKLMILDKTGVQASRPRTNSSPHKTFYSFSVTPGKTNYIFKKIKPAEEIEVNCLPNFKSARDSELSPAYPRHKNTRNYPELKIQTSTQISCTSFMKSYVEKLKKQRKRQNKKMRQSRNQKQLSEKHSFGSKAETTKNDIYLAKQMNHIFILERVSKKGGSGINTISLVEQDTNDILQQKFSKEKTAKWEQPAWANKERIDKLIRQIRNSRSKIGGSDEMAAISEEHVREHKMQGPNLPSIGSRQREEVKTRGKSKQTKRVELNFKTLEPWKQEQNMQDFSIQEYNVKCTSQ